MRRQEAFLRRIRSASWLRAAAVAFFVLTSTTFLVQARDIYVSPTGSWAGDGSLTKPYALDDVLAGYALPGDTVWLRGGLYKQTDICWSGGTTDKPLIVRQYPGERAIVDGGSTNSPALELRCGNV